MNLVKIRENFKFDHDIFVIDVVVIYDLLVTPFGVFKSIQIPCIV